MEYNSAAKLKQANLASKNDITDLVKNRFWWQSNKSK